MLSDRQKSVLFKTRIVSKPRYVRVPLQTIYVRFSLPQRLADHPPHAHYRLPDRRHRGRRKTLRDAVGYLRLLRRFRLRRPRFAAALLFIYPPSAFCVAAPDLPIGTRPLLFQEQVALRPCQQPVKTVGQEVDFTNTCFFRIVVVSGRAIRAVLQSLPDFPGCVSFRTTASSIVFLDHSGLRVVTGGDS